MLGSRRRHLRTWIPQKILRGARPANTYSEYVRASRGAIGPPSANNSKSGKRAPRRPIFLKNSSSLTPIFLNSLPTCQCRSAFCRGNSCNACLLSAPTRPHYQQLKGEQTALVSATRSDKAIQLLDSGRCIYSPRNIGWFVGSHQHQNLIHALPVQTKLPV